MDPRQLLSDRFGHDAFRPGQEAVVRALIDRGAALAIFPTGGGKSLCYQLPALLFEGVTLVVSPLIALMKDQIDDLHRRGVSAARLDSTLSAEETRATMDGVRRGTTKILYVAPERFNNERFLQTMRETKIALFAVDEAHCISEWGHNFRPDYLKLAEARNRMGAERVLALTATATPDVARDIRTAFDIPEECAVVTGFYRENLQLTTTPVTADDRDGLLVSRLNERPRGPTVVYVTLQKTAERVASDLGRAGLSAEAYHAGMDTPDRERVQDDWKASDAGIVVATVAFGMGIDKADVRYVYHYNLPKSLESYSQEIGRAGRDGAPAIVELFACADDVPTLESFACGDTPSRPAVLGLVRDLLSRGQRFDLDLYELSNAHDIRPLVLRTALTYLELRDVIRQGTPFYTTYEVKPLVPLPEIVGAFSGERAKFVADVFESSKKGRIYYRVDPAEVAKELGQERERVLKALEYLGEKSKVELRASGVRHPFTRGPSAEGEGELVDLLCGRFEQREANELARIQQVLSLVTHAGCQTLALVGHFGEKRELPCGHCTHCVKHGAVALFPPRARRPLADVIDEPAVRALAERHPGVLGEPRQLARFLSGLTSPALTKQKLSRHALFGVAGGYPFADVLDVSERALAG
jgi:ATP-dependent DNA helicase RecQ